MQYNDALLCVCNYFIPQKSHDTMSILYDNIQTSALLLNVMVLMNKKQGVVSHAVCSKLY